MIQAYAKITVPVPGTPVRVTSSEVLPDDARGCHGILVQALPSNTGKVFLGRADMNKTLYTGCYAFLAVPATNVIPSFSAALTLAPGAIQLKDFYVDVDVANDGVIVTALIA